MEQFRKDGVIHNYVHAIRLLCMLSCKVI